MLERREAIEALTDDLNLMEAPANELAARVTWALDQASIATNRLAKLNEPKLTLAGEQRKMREAAGAQAEADARLQANIGKVIADVENAHHHRMTTGG